MPHLSLSLLGPFQAMLDRQLITDFKSNKVRALLAYLAVESDRPHAREALAGLLWPDYSDRVALDNLRYTLSSLRRSIADRSATSPFLIITRDTLQFNPDSDYDLDVKSLQQTVIEQPPAIDQLRLAIELYRGSFLDGFSVNDSPAFEEWVLLKREKFEQQILSALHTLTVYHLAQAEYSHAESYARQQIGLATWDEEAHQQLMRLLALSGQRSLALAQFDVCRRALRQELDVEPSRATIKLYEEIRDGSFEIEAERLNNVPIPLTRFIGRQREVTEITQLLAPLPSETRDESKPGVRLLTLIGAGGCGKTRLANQVAHALISAQRFKHSVWWIDLSRLNDPANVPHSVAAVFDLHETSATSLTTIIANYLHDKEALLIFDNCEHLIEVCAQLIDTLLSACPQLRIMVTSREVIGLTGEIVYRVASLTLPDTKHNVSLAEIVQSDAIRLFVDRARTVATNWQFEAHASTIAQICIRLDGIPLAIELAATRLKMMSVDQIAARLDDRFQLLTSGSRTALPRHQTLRATMDWSYSLLTNDERTLFRRLAVFPGSWTFETAEAILGQDDILPRKVLDTLAHLVDKSLVAVAPRAHEVRYQMLETIRDYAREKLIAADEMDSMRSRHLEYFVLFAERAEPLLHGTQQEQWLDRMEIEYDNLRAALTWSLNGGAAIQGLLLAGALADFWLLRGYLSEGSGWLEKMLEACPNASAGARAKGTLQSGFLSLQQGAIIYAKTLGEESLALYRELEDRAGIANALVLSGIVAHFMGSNEQAAILLNESLSSFQEVGDRFGYAYALLWIARGQMRRGENALATTLLETSLAIFQEQGDKDNMSFALGSLGDLARHQGDYTRAANLRTESLRLAWEVGSKGEACYDLEHLALIASVQGESERAVKLWAAAEVLRKSINRSMTRSYAEEYNPAMAQARTLLGEERFATAWAEGRSLTIEQAINYALENPESQSAPVPDRPLAPAERELSPRGPHAAQSL